MIVKKYDWTRGGEAPLSIAYQWQFDESSLEFAINQYRYQILSIRILQRRLILNEIPPEEFCLLVVQCLRNASTWFITAKKIERAAHDSAEKFLLKFAQRCEIGNGIIMN